MEDLPGGSLVKDPPANAGDTGLMEDLPGGSLVKDPPANAGDTGFIPDMGRSHVPWGNEAHTNY